MTLLTKKDCPSCNEIKDIEKKYKGIHKFYVKEGHISVDGEKIILDRKISILPVLIVEKHYYFGVKTILDYLNSSGEEIAETNIL